MGDMGIILGLIIGYILIFTPVGLFILISISVIFNAILHAFGVTGIGETSPPK